MNRQVNLLALAACVALNASQAVGSETPKAPDVAATVGSFNIDDIASPHEEVRNQAIAVLEKSTSTAIPLLTEGLQSRNVDVRIRCVRLLEDYRASNAAGAIAKWSLHDPDWRVRSGALVALGRFKQPATAQAVLSVASEDSRIELRAQAIGTLSKVMGSGVVDQLRPFLNNQATLVRLASARELGRHGEATGYALALEALNSPERRVRAAAADALHTIGRTESLPHLQRLLTNPAEDRDVQASAWMAIRHIELLQMPPAAQLERLKSSTASQLRIERSWAARELSQMNHSVAKNFLVELASTATRLGSQEARFALGEIDDAR